MGRIGVLVWLRSRLWWNGLRSRSGAADAAAAVIVVVLAVAVSVGLSVGLGAMTILALASGDPEAQRVGLFIVCWVLAFLAVIAPVIFGSGPSAVPVARLAVFPLSRGSLFRISLGASFVRGIHLLWFPSLLAVSAAVARGRGEQAVPACVVLLVLAVCLVVWCHALLLELQRMLQRRSVRELVVLIGFLLLIAASLLPAIFESRGLGPESVRFLLPEAVISWVSWAAAVFPPSVAAGGVDSVLVGRPTAAIPAVAWLAVWTAAGVFLGYRSLARTLAEGGGSARRAPSSGKGANRAGAPRVLFTIDRLSFLAPQVRAVAAKELAYLLRSTLGKFNIVMMPLFVVVVGSLFGRDLTGPLLGVDATSLVFLGTMLYASMFSNNVIYNAFAWEGVGVQSYFLGPVNPTSVILGKNLGLWALNGVCAVECLLSFALVVGVPAIETLISGLLVFTAALLGSTLVGNFVSLAFPVARDPSKFAGTPSQTGVLSSFGMLVANAMLVGTLVAVPGLLGLGWLRPLLLGALVVVEAAVYRISLAPAGRLMAMRREGLVEALRVAS